MFVNKVKLIKSGCYFTVMIRQKTTVGYRWRIATQYEVSCSKECLKEYENEV